MSNDILFLAEFAGGAPARSALELAAGAAELAAQSGGSAVALAYGPGASDGAAALGGTKKAEAASADAPTGRGYRETEHVRKFYRSARF